MYTVEEGEDFVEGKTPEEAAQRWATLRWGKSVAQRTTGTPGLSGFFRAYRAFGDGTSLTSIGEPFHVKKT